MKHEKIANPSGQYEMSFEEIPDRKLEAQPELKDLDWGNYSEDVLKAKKEEEREMREIREEIQKTEEEEEEEDKDLSPGEELYGRFNQYVKEPASRTLTKEERQKSDLKIAKITAERIRKEEARKRKEWDDYWAK